MRIILSGGGTAGSVIPLLSIYTELKKQRPDSQFLFVGTKKGLPEKKLVSRYNIPFISIYGGKLRRYFDLRNLSDILLIIIGFIQSLIIIGRFKPAVVVGAGGFISVPVIWAAWVHRRKILIHQQDIKPSLSNILAINLTNKITVTFEKSLQYFPSSKTEWTGNPIRSEILRGNKEQAWRRFKLNPSLPLLLVVGGSTGARDLNLIVNQALPKLVAFCQIFHITGENKKVSGIDHPNYQQYEFISEGMGDVLAAADLIISRAGLSALTEFSALGKAVILVPLPNSHQEKNAAYFLEKGAAVVYQQKDFSPGILVDKVRSLLGDKTALSILRENISRMTKANAAEKIAEKIINLAE